MWLLDKFLKAGIKRGKFIVTDHDGKVYEYGPGADDAVHGMDKGPMKIRLTNAKAANHIARYPQYGAGEAFMWGWIVVEEPHDIRDMLLYVTENTKVHGDVPLKPKGPIRKAMQKAIAKADSVNLKGKARENAEHTYNLTRRLYELFLDEDRQYTCLLYTSPSPRD